MPTYTYECERCGHRFDLLQGMTDPPRRRCPECQGKVRRLIGAGGGLIFKGSGFYITDYKRKEQSGPPGSRKRGGGEKGTGDGEASEKSTGEKSTGEKSTGEKSAGEKNAGGKGAAEKPSATEGKPKRKRGDD